MRYRYLNDSYIIFICPFDLYGKGRHMYTFDGRCKEDPELTIGDGATRIFLNTKGTMEDVSASLRAFLDYVDGRLSDDSFVQELEEAVDEAKKNREWRHEYMTLMLRDQENIEKGIELGRAEGRQKGPCGRTSGGNPADGVCPSGFWNSERGNPQEDTGEVPAYGAGAGSIFEITGRISETIVTIQSGSTKLNSAFALFLIGERGSRSGLRRAGGFWEFR